MQKDGPGIAASDGSGEGLRRRTLLYRGKSADREREERLAGDLLGGAGRGAERIDGAGEERDRRPRGEDGRGVVERPRPAYLDRSHPQRLGDRRKALARLGLGGGDSGSRSAQDPRSASGRHRSQRMERSDLRAAPPRAQKRLEIEGPGAVSHELARSQGGSGEPADLGHRPVGDREEDQLRMPHAMQVGTPGRGLARPVPGERDRDLRGEERGNESVAQGAAAEHRGAAGKPDHASFRNSTPDGPARATSRSPARTWPARIASARGDSTSRSIVCRIGRAPSDD